MLPVPVRQVEAGSRLLTTQILHANGNCDKCKHIAHGLVKQQNELPSFFYKAKSYPLTGRISLSVLGGNVGSSSPTPLRAKRIIPRATRPDCLSDLLILQAMHQMHF